MSHTPLTRAEHAENEHWKERYGDGPVTRESIKVVNGMVQINDEFFSVEDLERADEEHPQPPSHPFKPHHYVLQDELESMLIDEAKKDLASFYQRFPHKKGQLK